MNSEAQEKEGERGERTEIGGHPLLHESSASFDIYSMSITQSSSYVRPLDHIEEEEKKTRLNK